MCSIDFFLNLNEVDLKVITKIKIGSKIESVEVINNFELLIRLRTPPIKGKANERIVELLAIHFNVAKSKIELISGTKSKIKIFEILY